MQERGSKYDQSYAKQVFCAELRQALAQSVSVVAGFCEPPLDRRPSNRTNWSKQELGAVVARGTKEDLVSIAQALAMAENV